MKTKHTVYGVVGYMGAGKSTLCRSLSERSIYHNIPCTWIEADAIRRELHRESFMTNGLVRHEVIQSFVYSTVEKIIASTAGLVLFEWALLLEDYRIDLTEGNILLANCPLSCCLQRLRGGDLSMVEIERRLSAHKSRLEKKACFANEKARTHRGHWLEIDTSHRISEGALDYLIKEMMLHTTTDSEAMEAACQNHCH